MNARWGSHAEELLRLQESAAISGAGIDGHLGEFAAAACAANFRWYERTVQVDCGEGALTRVPGAIAAPGCSWPRCAIWDGSETA